MADALFEVIGTDRDAGAETVLPTGYARGPWSPDALHGGPVATLVARAAERSFVSAFDGAHLVTRCTLDLERPVPLAPLTVHSAVVRPGRKVCVAEVTVADESGRRLARASFLAIRRLPTEFPEDLVVPGDTPPPPATDAPVDSDEWRFGAQDLAYHRDATEHRIARGSIAAPGPVTDWIRLVVPVVADEAPTPLQRVAAASDFLNGVSWVLPGTEWLFINPDLTITLHRVPVGDRIAVDAVTRLGAEGTGTAEADLYDTRGRIGRAVQTLLVERR